MQKSPAKQGLKVSDFGCWLGRAGLGEAVLKKFAVAVAVLGLAACQSVVDAESEFQAYVGCNQRNAVKFARQSGDPYSLAIAAEASCPAEENALLRKLNEARGPGGALRMMDDIRATAVRSNTGTIVRIRGS